MPLYAYECPTCGAECDQFNRIDDRHENAPTCSSCRRKMRLRLTPNLGYVQRDCCYKCPVTGQPITNHRQRRRVMDEHGLIDANDFKPAAAIAKAEKARERDKELIASVKHPMSENALRDLCA